MGNIEKLLDQEKKRMDNLAVPNDLEERLRSALENTLQKKSNFKLKVAVAFLVVLLLSYNMDTLAYYGKQLIGFENVMTGTLKELNEMGKGQIINQSHTFQNGVKITLDGIMLDDNNMVIFYTIHSPEGNVMDVDSDLIVSLTGFGNRSFTFGGQGQANKDSTEMKWVVSTHQTPKFYERTLKFKAVMKHTGESAIISFKLNRNQAVGKSLKIPINKKIDLDQRSIILQSLTASPITTVLKGQIQDIVELGFDYIKKNRFRPEKLEIALIADGKEIALQGGGMSTDMRGIHFDITYDALPENARELQLKLVSFGGDHDTDESVKLEKGKTKKFEVLGQEIEIENVYESNGSTYITFTTEENVILSKVYLNIDGQRKNLQETIPGESEKVLADDRTKAIIYYTRTMKFEGTGKELELNIKKIRYSQNYDMIIWKHSV
ncbi:MAG TPA: DUF4179 domain-containing protein [Peptococcaceae bacterium]|nr:DUF4179 domain-containing protein [Peptococcaceae bacterium]